MRLFVIFVRPSACHIPPGQKVKVTGNENVKIIFFAHIFVQSGSICVKPRAKWSAYSSHNYRQIHFNSERCPLYASSSSRCHKQMFSRDRSSAWDCRAYNVSPVPDGVIRVAWPPTIPTMNTLSVALRPSVCLSVCPVTTIYSKLKCRRNFIFVGHVMQELRN